MPRHSGKRHKRKSTNNADFAAKKAALGHRKDAVRSQLTEQLTPEALAGLEEQLAASVGMSGPPGGC